MPNKSLATEGIVSKQPQIDMSMSKLNAALRKYEEAGRR
jgi:hypothetical protein